MTVVESLPGVGQSGPNDVYRRIDQRDGVENRETSR